MGLNQRRTCDLFKLLLDVGVRLQFDLSAGVRPVHQEQPLLSVHLFDKYGRFLVVSHLKPNKKNTKMQCKWRVKTLVYSSWLRKSMSCSVLFIQTRRRISFVTARKSITNGPKLWNWKKTPIHTEPYQEFRLNEDRLNYPSYPVECYTFMEQISKSHHRHEDV